VPPLPVPTDEINERYLQKAISEVNELGDDISRVGEGRVPVLGSGHPLADVFLLKFRPQHSEVQEGVAFYGRAGQAILKSLQRLHVDPLAVYGTNCFKFADGRAGKAATASGRRRQVDASGGDEEQAAAWLTRELHIVQPKLVVVMGDEALAFLNGLEFPLSTELEQRTGELRQWTPTIEALSVPDIDASLDEQAAKTRFWQALKALGPWWAELPPY
jgi:uracil-DNA glycosylase family 4